MPANLRTSSPTAPGRYVNADMSMTGSAGDGNCRGAAGVRPPRAALLAAAREDQRPGPLSLGSALERGDAIGRIGVGVRQDGQRVKRVVGRFHGRYSSLMS